MDTKSGQDNMFVSEKLKIQEEIIAALGKIYSYISRVDIQADYYEEITGLDDYHTPAGNITGKASVNAKVMCEKRVADEYQEEFLEFTDMTTLAQRMDGEDMIELEYRLNNGDWSRMCFVEKRRNEEGRVTHVLCVVKNISSVRKLEQQLRYDTAMARLEANEKSRFLSNMSHDIRTPINGIIGLIDMAEHEPENLSMQSYCRNKIKQTSNYLLSLVNDVLDMNKLQTCEEDVPDISFDIAQLLRSCNEEGERKAAEKDIEYVINWDDTSYEHQFLIGNPVYTTRILEVISDNAIKFSKHGSKVEVWCREEIIDERHSIFLFGCRDYGIGMSKDFVSHAFDMFTQENISSRTEYEGTGLGLALAKKMADRMEAVIEIQSEKNVGTTVITRIPFEICKTDEIIPAVDYHSIPVEGLRVLVAEDNELNMEIAKFILEDNGLLVECAYDGVEAVKMFGASAVGYYDVILMDIMMPGLNGRDATRKIRLLDREDAEHVTIIAMSANAFAEDIISSRLSGMDMHISKPVDNKKIVDAIKKCIANKFG